MEGLILKESVGLDSSIPAVVDDEAATALSLCPEYIYCFLQVSKCSDGEVFSLKGSLIVVCGEEVERPIALILLLFHPPLIYKAIAG